MTVENLSSDAAALVSAEPAGFQVSLGNFSGPFDLLLSLISSHKLDVTEVALHKVTDEFISYTKQLTASDSFPLDQTTSFLVVAATLLDLKAARLLPRGDVEDLNDLEVLETRDLLFARLLQYRAFKQVADLFAELESAALLRYPRAVALDPEFAKLLPDVDLGVTARGFAEIAAAAFRPRPIPAVGIAHIHTPSVSIPDQMKAIAELLRSHTAGTWMTFGDLLDDDRAPLMIVGRFIALLELFRSQDVEFEQPEPLGELRVSWTGDAA